MHPVSFCDTDHDIMTEQNHKKLPIFLERKFGVLTKDNRIEERRPGRFRLVGAMRGEIRYAVAAAARWQILARPSRAAAGDACRTSILKS